jgi:hypothetical protein
MVSGLSCVAIQFVEAASMGHQALRGGQNVQVQFAADLRRYDARWRWRDMGNAGNVL